MVKVRTVHELRWWTLVVKVRTVCGLRWWTLVVKVRIICGLQILKHLHGNSMKEAQSLKLFRDS